MATPDGERRVGRVWPVSGSAEASATTGADAPIVLTNVPREYDVGVSAGIGRTDLETRVLSHLQIMPHKMYFPWVAGINCTMVSCSEIRQFQLAAQSRRPIIADT